MRKHFLLLFAGFALPPIATVLLSAAGCSGVVSETTPPDGQQSDGAGGGPHLDGAGAGTTTSTTTGGQHDAFPDYVDPGCPDAGPPIVSYACDPYHQDNGDCIPGEACYIYVQYPSEPCGQETYGSICAPAGPGQQGDGCGGAGDCAGGFVCVVSGSGNQCIKLCALAGEDGCPAGLVCEPIDVEGFGGCL